MTLVRVGIELDGDQLYLRAFEAYEREVGDLTEPFREVGHLLISSIARMFETQGSSGGEPWAPLSRAYLTWRLAHFPEAGARILDRSGIMKDVLTSYDLSIHVDSARLVYEPPASGDEDAPGPGTLAYWHQHGSGRLPARRIVALTGADRHEVDRIFAAWLNAVRRGVMGVR